MGDELKVEIPAYADAIEFTVLDLSGKKVQNLQSKQEGKTLSINTKTLSRGTYLIQFSWDSKVLATRKLVKN